MDHEGATYKTLRDEVAIAAMVVMLQSHGPSQADIAKQAYRMADAMLKAREC